MCDNVPLTWYIVCHISLKVDLVWSNCRRFTYHKEMNTTNMTFATPSHKFRSNTFFHSYELEYRKPDFKQSVMVDATAVFCATMLTKLPFTTHIVCHISTLTKIIINKNIRPWRSSVCLSLNSLYYRKEYLIHKWFFCWLSSSVQIECHSCKNFIFEKPVCIRLCHSIIISSNINEVLPIHFTSE